MENFKVWVSKDNKRYSIVFKAESESAARERVHKEWYSILSLEKIVDNNELWNTFIFKWFKDWKINNWKIVWDDIFKVYVKLRKNLEYDITEIFPEKESLSDSQKVDLLEELKEEYNIYYSGNKKEKIDELRDKIKESKEENSKLESFYLKKELEDTNKLIDYTLNKLQNLLSWNSWINLENDKLEKLKAVYNEIIKLRKSTNISKLKEIWELALLKVWNIELAELEKNKNKDNRDLLKETNKVLKKMWSKNQFVEKEKDLNYQFEMLISGIKDFFSDLRDKTKIVSVDKHSHSYIKTLLYIWKYKEKYNENTQFIIKNCIKLLFSKSLREETFITRKVIKQNISLLNAKIKGIKFSYTFLKKWFSKFLERILDTSKSIRVYLFSVVIIYLFVFLIYLNYSTYFNFNDYNYDGIFYFIIIILLYLILYFSRSIFLISLNFVFLFFIIIFWVINF